MKLALSVVFLAVLAAGVIAVDNPESDGVDVIIWFHDGGYIDSVLTELNDRFALRYRYENAPGVAGTITEEGLEKLKTFPEVITVYRDISLRLLLNQSRITVGANLAESYRYTGRNQTACVLDTGVDYTHPALGGCFGPGCKVISGYNFVSNTTNPMDDHGHGTHVAGIIASNHSRYRGIAPNARIAALKVCSLGGGCALSNVIAALDWCITNKERHNIQVASMSFGSGEYTAENCPASMDPIIDVANQRGISVVAASGNYGYTQGISFPACARHVISAGATYNKNVGSYRWQLLRGYCMDNATGINKLACFTNRASNLDLLAPGAFVTSMALGGTFLEDSGTSMAAPHVAAPALLLKEAYPALTPENIEALLRSSGTAVYDPVTQITYKQVHIANALQLVERSMVRNSLLPPASLPP